MRTLRIVSSFGLACAIAATTAQTVPAQERETARFGQLILAANRDCSTTLRSFTGGTFVVDPDLSVTVNNGTLPRTVIIKYSSEADMDTAGSRLNLRWSIDGGAGLILGPEFFAGDGIFQTRTAIGIIDLGPGKHTIRPMLNVSGAGSGAVWFRCMTAEGRTY